MMYSKNELRKRVKELKRNYSKAQKLEKSELIFTQVENNPFFINTSIIMIYWAMDDEVQTKDFILKWAEKKQFILPSVKGDELELKRFDGLNSLKAGESFGILEPMGEKIDEISSIDLIIVPGVAFDKENNRMGRGKGYYDKLLNETVAYKLGVCFDFQYFDSVPTDELDVAMDCVIFS